MRGCPLTVSPPALALQVPLALPEPARSEVIRSWLNLQGPPPTQGGGSSSSSGYVLLGHAWNGTRAAHRRRRLDLCIRWPPLAVLGSDSVLPGDEKKPREKKGKGRRFRTHSWPVVDMKYMKLGSKPDAFQTEGNSIR